MEHKHVMSIDLDIHSLDLVHGCAVSLHISRWFIKLKFNYLRISKLTNSSVKQNFVCASEKHKVEHK